MNIRISKLYLYCCCSFIAAAYMVVSTAVFYRQFFPTVVSLTNSKVFSLFVCNAILAGIVLFGMLFSNLFFGTLAQVERQALSSRIVFHFFDTMITLSLFHEHLSTGITLLFVLSTMIFVFHSIADTRQEHIEVAIPNNRRVAVKLAIALLFLVVFDIVSGFFVCMSLFNDGYSVLVIFAYQSVVRYMQGSAVTLRLLLQQIEVSKGHVWENKVPYKFYVNLFFESGSALIQCIYVLSRIQHGQIHLYYFPQLFASIRTAFGTIGAFRRFRVLSKLINQGLPEATPEQLDADRMCAICYDEMANNTNAKRLPCSHCFHYHCLRLWIQKNSSCPYCRQNFDIEALQRFTMQQQAQAGNAQAAPQVPNVANAAQQAPNAAPGARENVDADAAILRAYAAYLTMHKMQQDAAANEARVREMHAMEQSARSDPNPAASTSTPASASTPASPPASPASPRVLSNLLTKQESGMGSQQRSSSTVMDPLDADELDAHRKYQAEVAFAQERLEQTLSEISLRRRAMSHSPQ